MNLPKYPTSFNSFIDDTNQTAAKNGITIRLSKDNLVYSKGDDVGSYGYFSSDEKELAVAVGKLSVYEIMGLLVHESCHMDQYLNDRTFWNKHLSGADYYFSWLSHGIELSEKKIAKYTQDVIMLELDCEKRSVEKIKQYKLPIDIKTYKRGANSYLYGILYCTKRRQWYNHFYSYREVWNNAPDRFRGKYVNIPHNLFESFQKYSLVR